MINHRNRPAIQTHVASSIFTFILLIVFTAACNFPSPSNRPASTPPPDQNASTQPFPDKNARLYQMYFDSSADPTQNVLQVRRFVGQLHLADIEDIFGDIQSLPLDDNCNYVGGPTIKDGLIWYITVTPDLVGFNLVSVDPDGTISSAFDLDGDRLVDLLDIRLPDNRRISFVDELNGLEAFKDFLGGMDPFCSTELIRQLDLPNLGCDETGDGSSGGGVDSGWGGIVNPIDLLCSQYDTSPMAGIMTGASRGQTTGSGPRRTSILEPESYWNDDYPGEYRVVRTYVTKDLNTGALIEITKVITDVNTSTTPPYVSRVQTETVTSDGHGTRTIQTYNPDGTPYGEPYRQPFEVHPEDAGQENYDQESSSPPPFEPIYIPPSGGGAEGNPGPEGDDSNVAEFCRRRANYRSGVEQAADEDPTSMSVSCNNPLSDPDMPDDPNCMITEWARPDDFLGVLQPSDDGGCDFENEAARTCEPESVRERIRRIRGRIAELWSLDLPNVDICPQTVCDPGATVEKIVPVSIDMESLCPIVVETPTLVPYCPPDTYYDATLNRCVDNQPPAGGGDEEGGGCPLNAAICGARGFSFDSQNCRCVPIK